ncbi:MAG: thioether cross-link-forming SCIFF peptide maturase [Bacillota bacterium]|jgi:uncharacterized protein
MSGQAVGKNFTVNWSRDIHKFLLHGTRVLLDVNSGSVHIIDELAWDVLEALEQCRGNVQAAVSRLKGKYPAEEVIEVIGELQKLKQERILFTSDSQVEEWTKQEKEYLVKSLCLNVAHDCNMRCGYCFAAKISFGGKRELMSLEVGQKAIDFLLEQSGSRKHLEVDYFGGEPLLNQGTVQELTRYGAEKAARRGKKIKFTITTNCLLIDDSFIRFVNDYDMQVVLSLDGRQSVHDGVRRTAGGGPTYDTILPRMLKLTESRNHDNYYVRGTYTRKNMDFSKDVLHLFDLGFKHVSLEPVVAPPDQYGFSEEDIPPLEAEYEKLAGELLKRHRKGQDIDFFHFNVDLDGGVCIPKRIKGCGAGFEYLAVTPDGSLFPCHQFAGMDEFIMGDVFRGIRNTAIGRSFSSAHVYSKEACRDCWARFLCSGGCHANAHEYSGTILEPYSIACSLQKKRLECGIWFQLKKCPNKIV